MALILIRMFFLESVVLHLSQKLISCSIFVIYFVFENPLHLIAVHLASSRMIGRLGIIESKDVVAEGRKVQLLMGLLSISHSAVKVTLSAR